MSTSTLSRMSVRYFQTAIANLAVDKKQSGGGIIHGMPIFRSGTFKDSMGDQHTWELEHLSQMVFHFNLLRERGTLPNVPVRAGHKSLFGGGGEVVGYIESIELGGQDDKGNTLLVANLDITEPDALGKIERGTWRSRSAEIGHYESNDEAMYWPVLMGLAFVDLPAVEGLFSKGDPDDDKKFTPLRDNYEEGSSVGTKQKHHSQQTPPPGEGEGEGEGTNTGQEGQGGNSTDQREGEEDSDGEGSSSEGSGSEGDQTQSGGEGEAGANHGQSPPVTTHGQAGNVHTFSVNGQPTTDFAAVQRHIDNLENVLEENRNQARRDFVSELASSGRIAATQVEEFQSHALSLTDEQYESFKKMWEGAPENPLFQQHGSGGTTTELQREASEIETLRERVQMHQRSGMSEDKIKETESYKRLMELTDNKG